jgi:hypothetical protein
MSYNGSSRNSKFCWGARVLAIQDYPLTVNVSDFHDGLHAHYHRSTDDSFG